MTGTEALFTFGRDNEDEELECWLALNRALDDKVIPDAQLLLKAAEFRNPEILSTAFALAYDTILKPNLFDANRNYESWVRSLTLLWDKVLLLIQDEEYGNNFYLSSGLTSFSVLEQAWNFTVYTCSERRELRRTVPIVRDWVRRVYLSNEGLRQLIVNVMLHRIRTTEREIWKEYFQDWMSDPEMAAAYEQAKLP